MPKRSGRSAERPEPVGARLKIPRVRFKTITHVLGTIRKVRAWRVKRSTVLRSAPFTVVDTHHLSPELPVAKQENSRSANIRHSVLGTQLLLTPAAAAVEAVTALRLLLIPCL
jgi:hypothetical protein